jgi:hypothetical protein
MGMGSAHTSIMATAGWRKRSLRPSVSLSVFFYSPITGQFQWWLLGRDQPKVLLHKLVVFSSPIRLVIDIVEAAFQGRVVDVAGHDWMICLGEKGTDKAEKGR